jgi:pimeloyl-ACP methyl ester carboxylesterase
MYKKSILLTIALVMGLFLPRHVEAQAARTYSFSVEKTGKGPALILIPGLYCSGDVWKETVAHYKDRYTCYSLTLPGFAGRAPIHSDTLLATLSREIVRFIVESKLQKPLLVGHSLGGWLALKVAVTNSSLLGGVICVSSAPFLPALSMGDGISVDSASRIGKMIKGYMVVSTPEQTRQYQGSMLPTMMRDSAHIKEVTAMAVISDPATQGEMMYELFSLDLRPEMNKVQCPVLVLGDWVAYKEYGSTRENVLEKYQKQFAPAAHVAIAISDTSKHFIMFDEPVWFFGEVDKFLATR